MIENLSGEMWKDVLNYEGYYKVSNMGRVKGVTRKVKAKCNSELTIKERLYGGYVESKGYIRVSFCKDGEIKRFFIHNLVATHFIKNPKNKPQVNHIDGNKKNNSETNLEWCTCKENIRHAWKTGLNKPIGRDFLKQTKLKTKDVKRIEKELKNSSNNYLANKYNVSQSCISTIKKKANNKSISSYNIIKIFSINGDFIEYFKSQKSFCKKYNKCESRLSNAFKGGDKIVFDGLILHRCNVYKHK